MRVVERRPIGYNEFRLILDLVEVIAEVFGRNPEFCVAGCFRDKDLGLSSVKGLRDSSACGVIATQQPYGCCRWSSWLDQSGAPTG